MKNEIKKKLKGIEKICLVGAMIGGSFFLYGAGLEIFSSKENQNNFTGYGASAYIISLTGYLFASGKRNELENMKKY